MCAVIYELRYECWEQFLSGDWHPPTDCHYLSTCMCVCVCYMCAWAWQNGRKDCFKGLLKPIWTVYFGQSEGGCLHVWDLCPLRSRVSLQVTGYSNVSLNWVLMDCILKGAIWTLKPNSLECITKMPSPILYQISNESDLELNLEDKSNHRLRKELLRAAPWCYLRFVVLMCPALCLLSGD